MPSEEPTERMQAADPGNHAGIGDGQPNLPKPCGQGADAHDGTGHTQQLFENELIEMSWETFLSL